MRARRDRGGSSAWTPTASGMARWDMGPDPIQSVRPPVLGGSGDDAPVPGTASGRIRRADDPASRDPARGASTGDGGPVHPLDGLWDEERFHDARDEDCSADAELADVDAGAWGTTAWREQDASAPRVPAAGAGGNSLGGGLREAASSPAAAFAFARRHAAIVLVALVVAVGIAATHLFRAHADAVPVNAVVASPAASSTRAVRATDSSSAVAGTVTSGSAGSGTAESSSPGSGPGTPAASAPANVTVQVLGPVRHPGVVTLRGGSRVKDALEACGGLLPGADPAELNLAAVLQDADQVLVGTRAHPRGEVRQGDAATAPGGADADTTGSNAAGSATTGSQKAGAASTAVVNLNTATLEQLDSIPGVGPVTAQRILEWRTQHGRFSSPRELQEVDGIGPKSFARIAPHVTV